MTTLPPLTESERAEMARMASIVEARPLTYSEASACGQAISRLLAVLARVEGEREEARAERDSLTAELTDLRALLADQQRAFVAGVEAQYRHNDAERDRLAVELGEARAAGQRVAEAGTALLRIVDRDTVAVRDLRAAIAALAGGAR